MSDHSDEFLSRAGRERRSFIEKSSVAAGGIVLSGVTPGLIHAAGSDTLKLAVVGCGGRGTGAMAQAMKADAGVQLVAVADAFADNAQKCAQVASKLFPDWRVTVNEDTTFVGFDAYRKAIDLADVVILTTPPGFRPEHFEYAVSQGKHCFVEKPLATDAHGVRRVLAAARQATEKKLSVVVGLQRRFQNCYLETLARYREGAVGEIVSGQVYWNSNGVWVRERQAGQTEMTYQMRNWYYFNWLCGDHIVEQHMHNIDVANWFLGEYPASAQGMGGREVRKGPDHGQIFDHHFVEYSYPGGAVIASQSRHQPGCLNLVEERFQCTDGSIRTSGNNDGALKNRSGKTLYKHRGMFDISPYQIEHNELFASIRAGAAINNAEYGANSTLAAIMGRMATYTGNTVTWEQALNASDRLAPESDALNWDGDAPVMPDAEGRYPVAVPGQTKIG